MIELTIERYGQFANTARRAAADAPVPTCPEWTPSGLVEHVGQTQHWVASLVEERARRRRAGLGEAGEWSVERGAEGATWRHRHGTADGPATSLLLVLTRRRPNPAGPDDGQNTSTDIRSPSIPTMPIALTITWTSWS